MLGLLSVLDALIDMPMPAIVQSLPFGRTCVTCSSTTPAVAACWSASRRSSPGDFLAAHRVFHNPTRSYLDAVAWAGDTAKHLFPAGGGGEPGVRTCSLVNARFRPSAGDAGPAADSGLSVGARCPMALSCLMRW